MAELFSKKCPHCQGTGYFIEDFKFASPTSEGEYRAKAAKMKLPVSGFKKNNSKNFNNNKQQSPKSEPQFVQVEPIETNENPLVTAQEENNKKFPPKSGSRKTYNKPKPKFESEIKLAETVINSEVEIKPLIEETKIEKPENKTETESSAVVPKTRRPNRNTKRPVKKPNVKNNEESVES